MKVLNKILNVIIVVYFLSLIVLLLSCLFISNHIGLIFNIFFKLLSLFRFVLAIILVAFISNVTSVCLDTKKKKIKEVNNRKF